jgi:hypothetical protein
MTKDPIIRDVMAIMLSVADDTSTPEPVKAWITSLVERLMQAGEPDERFMKGYEIPAGVGAQADEYSIVREERLRVQKEAEAIKARETELYNCIMSTLNESTDTGAMGKLYGVQRIEKDQVQVKDWDSVWQYIQQTGSFDLLQKRVNEKAAKERFENGEAVPGAEVVKVPTLSFTKNRS